MNIIIFLNFTQPQVKLDLGPKGPRGAWNNTFKMLNFCAENKSVESGEINCEQLEYCVFQEITPSAKGYTD